MMRTLVAIDGTAGSGKSTVARLVAGRLGLPHIDTGATYRLVALHVLEAGVDPDDAGEVERVARAVASGCDVAANGRLRYAGQEVGDEIRTPEVTRASSRVAAIPKVREVLVSLQRRLVRPTGAVVEGRDIGTVVWPTADVKAYLDARPEVRAVRRAGDAAPNGALAAVRERDRRDSEREVGPMRPAPDALIIDTSDLTPDEVAERIVEHLRPRRTPNPLYRGVRAALSAIVRGPFRLELTGAEHIPVSGPAILAPNHRSLVDIPVSGVLTRRKVWFMAKDDLFRKKAVAKFLLRMGGFPVRRGHPDRTALNRALELLREGEIVGIFPEGTRRPRSRFEEIEDGLAYVALKSGAPVVPVALSATDAVFPKEHKLPRFVKIRARIGEPFILGGPVQGILPRRRIREATAEAQRRLVAVMDELEPR